MKLTYLLPIVPLAVLFDGFVSCLRTYTPAEIRDLAQAVEGSEGLEVAYMTAIVPGALNTDAWYDQPEVTALQGPVGLRSEGSLPARSDSPRIAAGSPGHTCEH